MTLKPDEHLMPPRLCPKCGHLLDMATGVHDPDHGGPTPGALSVCIRCATILVFAADMSLRRITAEEILALPGEVAVKLAKMKLVIGFAQRARPDIVAEMDKRKGKA